MWKLAALIAFALGMTGLASACGGGGDAEVTPGGTATTRPTQAPSPTHEAPAAGAGEIETTAGTFVITDTELADRWPNCDPTSPIRCVARTGFQFLIVWLERRDGGQLELEAQAQLSKVVVEGGAYVTASDGARTDVTAGGTDGSRFHVESEVPVSAGGFRLVWPDNPPVDLGK